MYVYLYTSVVTCTDTCILFLGFRHLIFLTLSNEDYLHHDNKLKVAQREGAMQSLGNQLLRPFSVHLSCCSRGLCRN